MAYMEFQQMPNKTPGLLRQMVQDRLIGHSVLTTYNNRTYRIDGISNKTPQSSFKKRDGTVISFSDYYKNTYGIEIKDQKQYLLIHNPRRAFEVSEDSVLYLVPELCRMTGITDKMRSNFKLMKALAIDTKPSPKKRFDETNKLVHWMNSLESVKVDLDKVGLKISQEMATVEAVEFPDEQIIFKGEVFYPIPRRGDFTNLTKSEMLIEAINLRFWTIFYPPEMNQRDVCNFVKQFQEVSFQVGFNVEVPRLVQVTARYEDEVDNYLRGCNGLQHLLCILRRKDKDLWKALKISSLMRENPVPMQCVTMDALQRGKSVVTKVSQQVNCKLGGQLWRMDIPLEKTMIIGMDVEHTCHNANKKSVVGFCATINENFTKYYSKPIFQGAGQEIITENLDVCVRKAIDKYHRVNNYMPEQIIVFRDGVGDGMLPLVAKYEKSQFDSAFHSYDNYSPKFAFIVVKKRVSLKAWKRIQNDIENPVCGTMIYTGCTSPRYFDFFEVSTSANASQGTVSPTHYHVIFNTTNISIAIFGRLVYRLTHLYYNWSGTISVPAPCRYAHKLAALIGGALHNYPHESLSDKLYFL